MDVRMSRPSTPNVLPVPSPSAGQDPTTRLMRYDAGKKSLCAAYLLWFFLSGFGIHRFYLGRPWTGAIMLVCTLLAIPTLGISLIVTGLFSLRDLFTIPGKVRLFNERLIVSLS